MMMMMSCSRDTAPLAIVVARSRLYLDDDGSVAACRYIDGIDETTAYYYWNIAGGDGGGNKKPSSTPIQMSAPPLAGTDGLGHDKAPIMSSPMRGQPVSATQAHDDNALKSPQAQ